jgi:hypothetical protein
VSTVNVPSPLPPALLPKLRPLAPLPRLRLVAVVAVVEGGKAAIRLMGTACHRADGAGRAAAMGSWRAALAIDAGIDILSLGLGQLP